MSMTTVEPNRLNYGIEKNWVAACPAMGGFVDLSWAWRASYGSGRLWHEVASSTAGLGDQSGR